MGVIDLLLEQQNTRRRRLRRCPSTGVSLAAVNAAVVSEQYRILVTSDR